MANSNFDYPDLSKPFRQEASNSTDYPDLSRPLTPDELKKIILPLPDLKGGFNKAVRAADIFNQDIESLPSRGFSYIKNLLSETPSEVGGAIGQVFSDPTRAGKNIVTGVGELRNAIVNTPSLIPAYLAHLGLINPETANKFPRAEENLTNMMDPNAPALPGDKLLQNIIPISAFSPEIAAGAKLAGRAAAYPVNAVRPSVIFRGNLSPEELASNLKATQGTNTGLGRVLESPTLNRLSENILPHVIGSGAEATMQKAADQVTKRATDLLEGLRGDATPEKVGEALQTALKAAAKETRQQKDDIYTKVNTMADESGLKVGRTNLQKASQDVLAEINKSPELKRLLDKHLLADLDSFSQSKEGNNLKLSNIFKGKLNDKANDYWADSKIYEYGIMSSLKDALSQDIESSISNSHDLDLQDAYHAAEKFYQDSYAPFEDRNIVKFTRLGGDPDMILQHFLRLGQNDRANLLTTLVSKLPDKYKDLVPYAHLSKSLDEKGQVDPIKMATLYNKLGENQKNVLFPDKGKKQQFEDFSNLVGKNKEAFYLMFNPKTGARNTDLLIKIAQIMGSSAGGIPGLIGGIGTGAIVGRTLNKLLTSPKVRENLVKKMISNDSKPTTSLMPKRGMLNMLLNKGSD